MITEKENIKEVKQVNDSATASVQKPVEVVKPKPDLTPLTVADSSLNADFTPQQLDLMPVIEQRVGLEAQTYPYPHELTSGLTLLSIISFLIISLCIGYGTKFISNLFHAAYSIRERKNAFDNHTINEDLMLSGLALNTCICEGSIIFNILLSQGALPIQQGLNPLLMPLYFILGAGVFYVLQIIGYKVLAYTFGNGNQSQNWLDGFHSTQSLLGLALLPISAMLTLHTGSVSILAFCAVFLYIFARIVFIFKSFRIFFANFTELLYFLLYLCIVEIAPVVILILQVQYFIQ